LTVAAIAGVVSLTSQSLALVYVIRPGLKPDPGQEQVGDIKIVAIERGVSLGQYAQRVNNSEVPKNIGIASGLPISAEQERIRQCLPGNVYFIQQNLKGFKDRSTSIVLYTYRVRTRLRLRGALAAVSGGSPAINLRHSRTTDQSLVPIWAQWPYRTGHFFIRFELFHKTSFLSLKDTPKFTITQIAFSDFLANCLNPPSNGKAAKEHGVSSR
jgi:hypothetical protein